MYRLIYFIPIWMLFLIIKIPTAIAGLFVIPLLYWWRYDHYKNLPFWTRPWANPEDWTGGPMTYTESLPKFWALEKGIGFISWYTYHAIRNPANGLRSYEWLDIDIDQKKVMYITPQYLTYYAPWYVRMENEELNTYWYLCWQGLRAGFKFVHHWNADRHIVIKFGWRVDPRHSIVTEETLMTQDGSFAGKFLVYRKG